MNIGIFLPNWVGDCVMATPALRALRRTFPAPDRIVGVMRPYVADVLKGNDWLDEAVLFDRRSSNSSLNSARVTSQLREQSLDAVVLMTNSLSTAWLAWRSGAPVRVGYARDFRSLLITRRLHAPIEGRRWKPYSAVDYYLDLAYAMDCPLQPRRLELPITAADHRAADALWRKFRLYQAAGVVVFSTGGAFGEAKNWPGEYFSKLALRIASETDHAVLIICGPGERESVTEIARAAKHPRVFSLADEELSIGLSKACVARASAMVATDSGPRHFAAAFDIPVVSLFGPTDPRWSINYHSGETRLFESMECGPCQQRTCPLGHHDCMRNLQVERVFQTLLKKIETPPLRRAA